MKETYRSGKKIQKPMYSSPLLGGDDIGILEIQRQNKGFYFELLLCENLTFILKPKKIIYKLSDYPSTSQVLFHIFQVPDEARDVMCACQNF